MNDEQRFLLFILSVMTIFDEADCHSSLFWRTNYDNRPLVLLALCNDTFWWATADAEEITPDNLPVLQQSLDDLQAVTDAHAGTDVFLSDLFAARVRTMRPQRPFLDALKSPQVRALFEAAGPERDRADEG